MSVFEIFGLFWNFLDFWEIWVFWGFLRFLKFLIFEISLSKTEGEGFTFVNFVGNFLDVTIYNIYNKYQD